MLSRGAGGQLVIYAHCLLKSKRFGCELPKKCLNKILVLSLQTLVRDRRTVVFQALLFVLCTVYGNSFHIVVLLIAGFTGGLLCGAGSVLCFWATSTIRDGRRSVATAEAVSLCFGHGQNDRGGLRRRSQILSPETDSEDSFDSTPASSGFSLQMATCIQRSVKSRQRPVWYGSTR